MMMMMSRTTLVMIIVLLSIILLVSPMQSMSTNDHSMKSPVRQKRWTFNTWRLHGRRQASNVPLQTINGEFVVLLPCQRPFRFILQIFTLQKHSNPPILWATPIINISMERNSMDVFNNFYENGMESTKKIVNTISRSKTFGFVFAHQDSRNKGIRFNDKKHRTESDEVDPQRKVLVFKVRWLTVNWCLIANWDER